MHQSVEVGASYGVVYKVVNAANGKCYVGQTIQPLKTRWRRHCQAEGSGCAALSSAIAKYGVKSFAISVVYIASSADELNSLEAFAIDEFDSMSPNGYNLRSGGGSKGLHSDESKLKMSASHAHPEVLEKHRASTAKKWEDPEYRAGMSAMAKARWADPAYAERACAALLKAASKPETKLRRSIATKAYLDSGGAAIVKAAQNTPEALAKRKESVKRLWENPDHVLKAKAAAKLAFTETRQNAMRVAGMARLAAIDTPARTDSKSGVRGVRWNKSANKWEARVTAPGKGLVYLGTFACTKEAELAYLSAKKAILSGEPIILPAKKRQSKTVQKMMHENKC